MNFVTKLFLALGVLAFLPQPALSEFVSIQKHKTRSCKIKLSAVINIPHTCTEIIDQDNPLEVWQNQLSFDFGRISRPEFNQLQKIYSGWSRSESSVYYDQNKSYKLIDFLPPIIQALNSHRFIPESANGKQLYMNCWGLIYEILRAAKDPEAKPAIFMAQGSMMLDLLRDQSNPVITLLEPEDFPISKNITQPGDILLAMHKSSTGKEYLDHIAIAIDDGVYFEKAGTGADVPIRIIDEVTLRKIWQPGVFNYELRRLKPDAVFPHPQDIFSLNSSEIKRKFPLTSAVLNNSKNITVMWEEEQQETTTSSWFHLIDRLPLNIDMTGMARLKPESYSLFLSTDN